MTSTNTTDNSGTPLIPGTGPGKLYVFIHGLISLVEMDDCILGIVVDMGDDHSYRVGDWLEEAPMKCGSPMELKLGPTSKPAPSGNLLDATKVTIVRGGTLDQAFLKNKAFATIRFPKPNRILQLRRTSFPDKLISGDGKSNLNHTDTAQTEFTLAGLRILEYDFDDLTQVTLENGGWGPPTVFRASRVATLHFFAEPEQVKPLEHPIDEFSKASTIFEGVNLTISNALVMRRLETDEYPTDLSTNEALSLIERRTVVLSPVAAAYKGDTPGELAAQSTGGGGSALCRGLDGN
jgi:hypothetical protein